MTTTSKPAAWTERYESLRRYVLESRAVLQAQPLGLVLWMTKGLAGWMNEWSKLSQSQPMRPGTLWLAPATGSGQAELTMLLAQMTLSHLSPTCRL